MSPKTCLWSDELDDKLIKLVKAATWLWDVSAQSGHNIRSQDGFPSKTSRVKQEWSKIGANLGDGITGAHAISRFSAIKTRYARNFKKVKKSMESGARTGVFNPKWRLYHKLDFLAKVQASSTSAIGHKASNTLPLPNSQIFSVGSLPSIESYQSTGTQSQEEKLYFDPHRPICLKMDPDTEEPQALLEPPCNADSSPGPPRTSSLPFWQPTSAFFVPTAGTHTASTSSPSIKGGENETIKSVNGSNRDETEEAFKARNKTAEQTTPKQQNSVVAFGVYVAARLQEMSEDDRERAKRAIFDTLETSEFKLFRS